MNQALEAHPELRDLLDRLATGELNESERKQLQLLAAATPESRDFYIQYMQIDAGLQWHYRNDSTAGDSPATIRPPAFHWLGKAARNRPLIWSMLAASVLFAAYFTAISWNMWGREQPERREMAKHESDAPTKPAVAKISDAGGAVWANESAAKWTEPSVTANEPLKIESGVVRLTLKQGTMLTIEAPAEWSITGGNQARLKRGKVFAHVPPQATGFTLDTPTAQIVDLGTEFSAVVSKSGHTSLHVVKGEVQLAQNTALRKPQRLEAGESAKVSKTADGTVVVERIPFDAKEATVQTPAKPLDRWREASQKLRTDPSLVAYYDFQTKGSKLQNVVADKLHGEITTPREAPPWTDGRWFGKNALAFGQDFASVSIADDPKLRPKGDFSFALWFRADAIPAPGTFAPLLVKGSNAKRNYTLWIQDNGALNLAVNQSTGVQASCVGTKSVGKSAWNLAVGMIESRKVRLFLNGTEESAPQPLAGELVADDEPILLGRSSEAGHPYPFTGVIDELAIFSRALSADEIAEMYRTGKPER